LLSGQLEQEEQPLSLSQPFLSLLPHSLEQSQQEICEGLAGQHLSPSFLSGSSAKHTVAVKTKMPQASWNTFLNELFIGSKLHLIYKIFQSSQTDLAYL